MLNLRMNSMFVKPGVFSAVLVLLASFFSFFSVILLYWFFHIL